MLDSAGNILTENKNGAVTTNVYNPNNLNELQQVTSGGQTQLYWYDAFGRQQCVTDTGGSQANCNPSENTTASTHLINDNQYDYLDRLTTYRAFSGGNRTDEANYVYDALNRQVQESEQHPSLNGDTRVTTFSYLGMGSQDVEETQTSKNTGNVQDVKDFTYDVNGHRLAMTDTPFTNGQPTTPTTSTYGYDVHGSVSQLVDPNGSTTASYGYTPYGQSDGTLSQGDPDPVKPANPFRFSGSRIDTGSGNLDMGVRRFGPDIAHFLTPDFFYGSLSDLSLSSDPLTANRYDLAGGNPVSFKEWDGHQFIAEGTGGASTTPTSTALAPGDRCGGCLDGFSGGAEVKQPTVSKSQPPAQAKTSRQPQRCGGNWLQQQLCLHRNDLHTVAKVSEAVAGVATAVGVGCAIAGAITSETIVGGITGASCAAAAFTVAGVASGVAAVANIGAKVGGADVSNVEIGLDVLGAVPGVGVLAKGARAATTTEELTSAAGRAVGAVGAGRGAVYGTRVHAAFETEVNALGRADLSTEVSYLNGQVVRRGTPGSVRLDVVEGDPTAPRAVYDLKTGSASLTSARISQIQSHLPMGFQNTPVIPIYP